MTISIVACGPSASGWFNTPYDLSIGVNDCLKFGHDTDYLLCVNAPQEFQPKQKNGYTNRLDIIKSSSAKFVTSLCQEWRKHKPLLNCIQIKRFNNKYQKGMFYFTRSSSFIAIQYAHWLGAKDIILWGVDFIDHPSFPKERATEFEIEQYQQLIGLMDAKVWVGTENTRLKEFLPVWKG